MHLRQIFCHSPEARPGESTQMQTQTEAQIKVETVLYLQSETKPLDADYEMRQPEKSKCEA